MACAATNALRRPELLLADAVRDDGEGGCRAHDGFAPPTRSTFATAGFPRGAAPSEPPSSRTDAGATQSMRGGARSTMYPCAVERRSSVDRLLKGKIAGSLRTYMDEPGHDRRKACSPMLREPLPFFVPSRSETMDGVRRS
jgi:hypothetical protein